jgi:Cysteine rich repeat
MNRARTKLTLGLVAAAFLAFSGGAQAATVSFAEAMSVMSRDCGKDVSKYCKGVPLANNGVGQCLVQNQAKVSPTCIATLAAVRASLEARLTAQKAALKVCRGDASRRCQGVVQTDGHILECLLKAANHVTKKCNAAITDAGWR